MSDSYKTILKRLLDQVDDTLDKRQGAIIYDALAPAALELAQCYASLEIYQEQTYLKTATGDNLDYRCADYGITRKAATYAIKLVKIYNTNNELMDVDLGTRFSVPEDYGGYNYTILSQISTGYYRAQCETSGTVGNQYTGTLLPLYNINGLGQAEMLGVSVAGEDIEDDETLRARAIAQLNNDAFGGNVSDYRRYLNTIDGVGEAKVFPIWNGGGTVKISFINSDNSIPSSDFIDEVQTLIDPIQNHGEGLGLAPIGHTVTVVAPTTKAINVKATIQLLDDYTLLNVEDAIKTAITAYITEVQNNWESATKLTVYISRLIAAILSVDGVDNVTSVLINDANADLILTETATTQEFPEVGTITITVG